jgi:hypothetical protein
MNESGILKQQEYYENEQNITKYRFNRQNILENRITNNMLKINLCLYGISLTISFLSVIFLNKFFYLLPLNTKLDANDKILFSIFDFTYVTQGIEITNELRCVHNKKCDNNCTNVDINKIKLDYGLDCECYAALRTAGLIVIIINKVCIRNNIRWMY